MDAKVHIEVPTPILDKSVDQAAKVSVSRTRRRARRRSVTKAEVAFVDHFATALAKCSQRLR